MSLTLDLTPELETQLAAEADRAGSPLHEYVVRILTAGVKNGHSPCTGAELVAYWQAEGLIGTRPDITDSAAHARHLRNEAERGAGPENGLGGHRRPD